MPFMPEENKKQNKKEIAQDNESQTQLEPQPANKKVDTIAETPEVDLLKEKDSVSADEVLASKKTKEPEMLGQPLFSWESPEFVHYEKGVSWYLVVITLALLAIVVSIYFRQWIVIAVIVMFTIVFIQYGRRKPKTKECSIYENGIKIDDKTYFFKQLKSFWVIEGEDETSLNLEPLKRLSTVVTIPLADIKISDLKSILAKHLPEQQRTEGIVERTSRRLKF